MSNSQTYQHITKAGDSIGLPVGKVVCIGRNYLAHIQELNNERPARSLYFMKPQDALVSLAQPIVLPKDKGSCHHELEIAVLIQHKLAMASLGQVERAIWGYGLALDLTLRDLQTELKQKGQPWERAKAFDGSCPVSYFIPAAAIKKDTVEFSLSVNGRLRQRGDTANMMLNTVDLIHEISHLFTLNPGDVVLTGTPEGVAELNSDDGLELAMDEYIAIKTQVA